MRTLFFVALCAILLGCTEDLSLTQQTENRDLNKSLSNISDVTPVPIDAPWKALTPPTACYVTSTQADAAARPFLATVNGDFYIYTGDFWSSIYKFNKTTKGWITVPDDIAYPMTQAIEYGRRYLFSYGNNVYTGLYNGKHAEEDIYAANRKVFSVDVTNGTSIQRAPFPGTPVRDFSSFSIGTKGYVMGGYDYVNHRVCDQFWEYDFQTNHWTNRGSMPGGARAGATVLVKDNSVYIGLGYYRVEEEHRYTDDYITHFKRDMYRFNPATSALAVRTRDFPGPGRREGKGFILYDKLYLGWGFSEFEVNGLSHDVVDDFWEYNRELDKWTEKPNLHENQDDNFGREAFSFENVGYVVIGCSEFWRYKKPLEAVPAAGTGPIIQATNP